MSDDQDLKKLTSLIEKDGYEIFVRDVSFLGFPAYCIYIPGITEFRNIINETNKNTNTDHKSFVMSAAEDLFNASNEQIEALASYMVNGHKSIVELMKFDNDSFLVRYNKNLAIGLLYLISGNIEKAYDFIKVYVEHFVGTPKEVLFFSALRDKLLCSINKNNPSNLNMIYDKKTLKSIDEFMKGKAILKYIPYRSFKHNDWYNFSKSHPDFLGMLQIMKRLENAYIDNTPDQEGLKTIFC